MVVRLAQTVFAKLLVFCPLDVIDRVWRIVEAALAVIDLVCLIDGGSGCESVRDVSVGEGEDTEGIGLSCIGVCESVGPDWGKGRWGALDGALDGVISVSRDVEMGAAGKSGVAGIGWSQDDAFGDVKDG